MAVSMGQGSNFTPRVEAKGAKGPEKEVKAAGEEHRGERAVVPVNTRVVSL